jgi:hypothetical protein
VLHEHRRDVDIQHEVTAEELDTLLRSVTAQNARRRGAIVQVDALLLLVPSLALVGVVKVYASANGRVVRDGRPGRHGLDVEGGVRDGVVE